MQTWRVNEGRYIWTVSLDGLLIHVAGKTLSSSFSTLRNTQEAVENPCTKEALFRHFSDLCFTHSISPTVSSVEGNCAPDTALDFAAITLRS